MTVTYQQRRSQNSDWMKSSKCRWGLLSMIGVFYLITLVAALIGGGDSFPRVLWHLDGLAAGFVNTAGFVLVVIAIHWFVYGRRSNHGGTTQPS